MFIANGMAQIENWICSCMGNLARCCMHLYERVSTDKIKIHLLDALITKCGLCIIVSLLQSTKDKFCNNRIGSF